MGEVVIGKDDVVVCLCFFFLMQLLLKLSFAFEFFSSPPPSTQPTPQNQIAVPSHWKALNGLLFSMKKGSAIIVVNASDPSVADANCVTPFKLA